MSFLDAFDAKYAHKLREPEPAFTFDDEEEWTPLGINIESDSDVAELDVDIDLETLIKSAESQPNYTQTNEELERIIDLAVSFCGLATGVELYPYQQAFQRRIIASMIHEDSEEITALFSRQSGKTETVASTIVPMLLFLPLIAKTAPFDTDSRLAKFKNGLWVGVFGPTNEIVDIMGGRMQDRIMSQAMQEMLTSDEFGMTYPARRKEIRLSNGSFVDCVSASPQSKIEGKTYHLIVTEETQDIANVKLRKSIHPMGAATAATLVKIGTPSFHRNDFYDACKRGERKLIAEPKAAVNHYQFDYRSVLKYNYRYAKYIKQEIHRLGADSDEFRMSYRLEWLIDRGHFLEDGVLDACGIKNRETMRVKVAGRTHAFTMYDAVCTSLSHEEKLVAALDIGKTDDSTVLTIAKVFWENPISVDGEKRYHTHIVRWVEIQGSNHEEQFYALMEEINAHDIVGLIVDCTGKGDPIYDRIAGKLRNLGKDTERGYLRKRIDLQRFVFSDKSKDAGYTLLKQELVAKRLTFPDGEQARKRRSQRQFRLQMTDLVKTKPGKYIKVEAPRYASSSDGSRTSRGHDDYPDSLMMLVWYVNKGTGTGAKTEKNGNPFYGGDKPRVSSYSGMRQQIRSIRSALRG
jgi:hypothetical protein